MKFFLLSFIFLIFGVFQSCSNSSTPLKLHSPQKGEYIFRNKNESINQIVSKEPLKRQIYPWEETRSSQFPKITKDFFRCKGSSLNPVRLVQKQNEIVRYYDCGGPQKHSLPLRDQKEFIYPILLELLNYIQEQTGKRIVITCGHCCPEHNAYLDSLPSNQSSKHMMGAEVDFYVQGMEWQPEKIIEIILTYYRSQLKYRGLKEYEEFKIYDKEDTNVSQHPLYNKEIFIKLFKKIEGRDFDNRHPYPYISIQVRHDWDLDEKVTYSWNKVFHNFHRW